MKIDLRRYIQHKPLMYCLAGGIIFGAGCKSWEDRSLTDEQKQQIWLEQRKSFWNNYESQRDFWRGR